MGNKLRKFRTTIAETNATVTAKFSFNLHIVELNIDATTTNELCVLL